MTNEILLTPPEPARLTEEQKLKGLLVEAKELLLGSRELIKQERAEKASLRSQFLIEVAHNQDLARLAGSLDVVARMQAARLERIPRWVRWLFSAL